MAFLINNQTVINNDREIATGMSSGYDTVTSGGSASITNRTVYYVTSNLQTITLPSAPTAGNEVVIIVGNYNGVQVSPGISYRVMGGSPGENMTIDIPYAAITLIYIDSTQGWVVC
jgi:hypothetical protein